MAEQDPAVRSAAAVDRVGLAELAVERIGILHRRARHGVEDQAGLQPLVYHRTGQARRLAGISPGAAPRHASSISRCRRPDDSDRLRCGRLRAADCLLQCHGDAKLRDRDARSSPTAEPPMIEGVGREDWRRWRKQVIPGCIEWAIPPLSGAQQDLLTGRAAGFFLALCCCAGRIH